MIHLTLSRIVPFAVFAILLGCQAQSRPPMISGVGESIQPFIQKSEISGAVTCVVSKDGIAHLQATGLADIEKGEPMRTDHIMWIASMTKPITAAAVLMLQDEGKLSLDDPVSRFIPEFANLKTPSGKPANLTIRQILTHTSGLAEAPREQEAAALTLADLIPSYLARPTSFEPGSKWQYCQSGINTAGRIVEVVSGKSLPEFFQQRLLGPMGMKDTTFYLTSEQARRLAKSYKLDNGKLVEADIFLLQGKDVTSRRHYPAANGGLFSTAGDYARFCRMLLNQGTLEGRRYLSAAAVKQMATIQTGDLKTGFTDGNGWGIGCCVVREPQGVTAMLSPGTFGHGGAYGTQAWIDPVKDRAYILFVQRANFPNADNSDVRKAFQEAAAR